jgi:ADP-ribose pyrophosphatase YjhB (NUDIX family)
MLSLSNRDVTAPVFCGAGVFIYRIEDDTLKVLLGKERWGRHKESWGLLGGKIQEGCVEATARNELLEESCGLLHLGDMVQRFTFDVSGTQAPHKMYRIYFAIPAEPMTEYVGDFAERIWLYENDEIDELRRIAPECFTAEGVIHKDFFEKTDMKWFNVTELTAAINSNWSKSVFRRDLLFMLHELKKTTRQSLEHLLQTKIVD